MEIQCHGGFEQLEESLWDRLVGQSGTNVPFLRYGYLQRWWQFKGGGEWPADANLRLYSAKEGEQLVGIAPLFSARDREGETVYLLGSIEISDYLDFIAPGHHIHGLVNGVFSEIHKDKNIRKMLFVNIPEHSLTLPALETAAAQFHWNLSVEKAYHTPAIRLANDWETYLAGIDKKQRHEIRRKLRRAGEESDTLKWYIVSEGARLGEELEDFLNLMALDDHKRKFLSDPMRDQMRAIAEWAFDSGFLQLSFLTIDGEKASGYFCFDYNHHIYIYNSGFNPRFSAYSPGWVHLGFLIQYAIAASKRAFDFMRGDEQYKYRFGASDSFVMRAEITRKTT